LLGKLSNQRPDHELGHPLLGVVKVKVEVRNHFARVTVTVL